ncbi:MAG TPA: hydantoinase/oxoprolinase family protein [Xanthobacteraceae bacterium]|nr:hydantoinase/oxoprolinase family protein [Xanthobacteraceae bacterium]
MSYRIGVDIGGTFADFVALDEMNRLYTLKVSTTPDRPGGEVIEGIRELKRRYGIEPQAVSYFTHGTTVGVNGLIQRQGAKLGLFVTEGFEDVLELGRLKMPDMFNLFSLRPKPLVPRDRVFAISERMLPDGSVGTPVDLASVDRAIAAARAEGVESVVVALLHSYRNGAHERAVKEHIRAAHPDLFVTCSSDVWAEIREYERTVTATINAFVQPRMTKYLSSLQAALRGEGVSCEPQITKSNGGVMRAELGKENCVSALLSGTASGVIGASFTAQLSGFGNIASIDIGGTSADVALIIDGRPSYGVGQIVGEFSLHAPAVAVDSIGGGGGSIAWVDEHGVLKSGPTSAGSQPGPACYNRGGKLPTTTDAYVVTGFLGQAELAYGSVELRKDLAEVAIQGLATTLNRNVLETAEAVIQVAVSGMYAEMMRVLARNGVEAKSLGLLAFGGAGPMMACWIAREVGIDRVVVPPTPGVLSALGGLVADSRNDFVETIYVDLDRPGLSRLAQSFGSLAQEGERWLRNEQHHKAPSSLQLSADMRYRGQAFELDTLLDGAEVQRGNLGAVAAAFHAQHERVYGYSDPEAAIQIINARVTISAANPKPDFPARDEHRHRAKAEKTVQVYCDGAYRSASIFRREDLAPGAHFEGPAIVLQNDTTTCVLPGFIGRVDGHSNLILEMVAR